MKKRIVMMLLGLLGKFKHYRDTYSLYENVRIRVIKSSHRVSDYEFMKVQDHGLFHKSVKQTKREVEFKNKVILSLMDDMKVQLLANRALVFKLDQNTGLYTENIDKCTSEEGKQFQAIIDGNANTYTAAIMIIKPKEEELLGIPMKDNFSNRFRGKTGFGYVDMTIHP